MLLCRQDAGSTLPANLPMTAKQFARLRSPRVFVCDICLRENFSPGCKELARENSEYDGKAPGQSVSRWQNPALIPRRICHGRVKMHDCLIRPGIPQFFAGQSFDGFGVVFEGVNFTFEFAGDFRLILDFLVQLVNLAPVILILLDQRQVRHADEQQNGHRHQRDDYLR